MLILLIDDNPIDLLVHTKVLESSIDDVRVEKQQSAVEALAHLQKNPLFIPDIILLDIKMPLMDGFEFLDALREEGHPVLLHSRIIIVSSSIDPKDLDRANQAKELSGFIQKPVNAQELKDLLLPKS